MEAGTLLAYKWSRMGYTCRW